MVILVYRRLRFVVWNRGHIEDINRGPVVVMPMYVQLLVVEFYNLINISGIGYMQITSTIYGCTLCRTAP